MSKSNERSEWERLPQDWPVACLTALPSAKTPRLRSAIPRFKGPDTAKAYGSDEFFHVPGSFLDFSL